MPPRAPVDASLEGDDVAKEPNQDKEKQDTLSAPALGTLPDQLSPSLVLLASQMFHTADVSPASAAQERPEQDIFEIIPPLNGLLLVVWLLERRVPLKGWPFNGAFSST